MTVHDDDIEALLRRRFDGPVSDDGFSDAVMRQLPQRRRRAVWPLWAGVAAGVAGSWACLTLSRWLPDSWGDYVDGDLSLPAVTLLVAMVALSLLAGWWALADAGEH